MSKDSPAPHATSAWNSPYAKRAAGLNSTAAISDFTRSSLSKVRQTRDTEKAFDELADTLSTLSVADVNNVTDESISNEVLGNFIAELKDSLDQVKAQLNEVQESRDRQSIKEHALEFLRPGLEEFLQLHKEASSDLEDELKDIVVSEVIKEYVADKLAQGVWTEKSKNENEAGFKLFLDIVGDKPFSQVKHRDVNNYISVLRKLPANINKIKRFRNKTPQEIIALPNITPRSIQTVKKEAIRVGALFDFAVRFGYTDKNYARGKVRDPGKRAQNQRHAFTTEDLEKLLFNDEFLLKGRKKRKHDHCFWLPLIGLYTGARINEICQLHLSDIREKDGILCFYFNSEDGKRLKTRAGERYVPVHKKLVELGLIKRVERLKQQKEYRLFPELTKKRDGYGAAASKWFTRYKRRHGIEDPKKVFHSFRHTVADSMKQKGIPLQEAAAVLGHADKSQTYGRYGKIYNPKALIRAVQAIEYGLDLSPLKDPRVNPDLSLPRRKRRKARKKKGK